MNLLSTALAGPKFCKHKLYEIAPQTSVKQYKGYTLPIIKIEKDNLIEVTLILFFDIEYRSYGSLPHKFFPISILK